MKYIKESFSKFKKDVLSNVFYDIMKYFFGTVILVAILKYTPIVNEKLELERKRQEEEWQQRKLLKEGFEE